MTGRRIRIAHILTRFLQGGSERGIASLIEALDPDRYEHILIVGRDSSTHSIRALLGDIRYVTVPTLVRRPSPTDDLRALVTLTRALRTHAIDIVHTCQSKAGILGRAAARAADVPYRIHTVAMANFGDGYGGMSRVYRAAERLASRWTDQYLVYGEDLMARFVDGGVADRDRFRIVRCEVDLAAIAELRDLGQAAVRRRLGLPLDLHLVLFAGSLDERKGARDLPALMARLREVGPAGLVLLIAGEGPLTVWLQKEMAKRNLTHAVKFLGFTTALAAYHVAADCFVQLSRAEGISTVSVQAAAAGIPFVSYHVDGVEEMLRLGAAGSVVEIGDVDAAARAVARQLDRKLTSAVNLESWSARAVRDAYREAFDAASDTFAQRSMS